MGRFRLLTLTILMFILVAAASFAALDDNFIHAYQFNNTAQLTDYVGTEDSTSSSANSKTATGIRGYAWDFEADSNHKACGDDWGLDGLANYTMSYWTNEESIVNNGRVWETDGVNENNDVLMQTASNNLRVRNDLTGGTIDFSTSASTIHASVWTLYVITLAGGTTTIYMNGSNSIGSAAQSGTMETDTHDWSIAGQYTCASGAEYDGLIDEFYIWNRTLSTADIDTLWNSGSGTFCDGDPCSFAAPAAGSSTIDILFTNTTSNDQITSTLTDTLWNVSVNWTDDSDNSALNSTAHGNCTLIVANVSTEHSGNDSLVEVCNTGCEYDTTFQTPIADLEGGDIRDDIIHFQACHQQTPIGNLQIGLQCSGGSYSETINAGSIPLCSVGNSTILVNTSVCTAQTSVTVNVTADVPNAQRKTITNLNLDRRFNTDTMNMTFSGGTQLWVAPHSHEVFDAGQYLHNVSCDHTSDNNFDASVEENLTVVGVAPTIDFEQVITSLGTTTLTEGVNIEFANSTYQFFIAIEDPLLDTLNINFTNSSNSVLASFSSISTSYNLSSSAFVEEDGNDYTIQVWANNTNGNFTWQNLTFSVNDTTDPSISIVSPANMSQILSGIDVNITVTATDEMIWIYNLSVTNSSGLLFSNNSYGANLTSITIQNILSSLPIGNYSINWTVKDGHTSKKLKDKVTTTKPSLNIIEFPFSHETISIEIVHSGELDYFEVIEKDDRYAFDARFNKPVSTVVFRIYARDIKIVPNNDWPCWLVLDSLKWWDADIPGLKSCDVEMKSGYAEATVNFNSPVTGFVSNSIGELNSVTVLQEFEVIASSGLLTWNGVVCGENYPYDTFTFNFTGQGYTNCTLKINEKLYDRNWSADCGQIPVELGIGEQDMRLTARDANNTEVISRCNIWTDKLDKDLADYVWMLVWIGLIVLFFVGGTKLGALNVIAGILIVLFGFQMFIFSWVVAAFTIFAGLTVVFGFVFR